MHDKCRYLSNENESSASCATFKCGLGGLRVAKIEGCGARFPSESDAAYLGWAAAEVGSSLLHCNEASDVGLLDYDYSWMWLEPMLCLCILIVHAWFKHLFENINIIHTEPHRTHRSIYKSTWFLKH